MLMVGLVCGILLCLIFWYISTILIIAYHPSSVLTVSVNTISMKQVWCGMVTLDRTLEYCAEGTAELRLQNRLWGDVTVLSFELVKPLGYDYEGDGLTAGFLQVGGTVIDAMSDDVYVLPMILASFTDEDYRLARASDLALQLDLYAMGFRFPHLDYGIIKVSNFSVPTA